MKKRKSSKKVDKWKLKKWYTVVAPDIFDKKEIGEIISSDPSNLENRLVPVPATDLIGRSKPEWDYSTFNFRVESVKDNTVYTKMVGLEVAFSYLRALSKRRRTVMHDVIDVKTKDGYDVRLKLMVVTLKKVSSVVEKNLRKELINKVLELAKTKTYQELIRDIIDGRFTATIFKHVNRINPIQHLVIKKLVLNEEFAA